MSRHSRFIAAILCVLFALTSLCTFAVFAEDIGGGGGADGGDPNGYSDQGGNEGGETPGGGSGDDSGSGSGSGDDSGSGSGSGSGDDSGSGSGSGSDSGSGSGSGGGYSGDDSGSGSGGYSGGGSSSGSSSGSSNYDDDDDDSDYSGGSSYYDSNGNEYNSPDEVYVGGNQTYTPPASTPSTTAALFDAIDTAELSLEVLAPMLRTATFHPANMKKAAQKGFINATDCADYMVKKGIPFRDAYKVTGQLVKYCIDRGMTLDELPIAEYRQFSLVFDEDVYQAIDLLTCVSQRRLPGGPAPQAVQATIEATRARL